MSDDLSAAARKWRGKAENDWLAVRLLCENSPCPYDVVCFHCQQYVEKLIKGVLTLHGVEAPHTHDLRRLVRLCLSTAPDLESLIDIADQLTFHGVESRYPDDAEPITEKHMRDAIRHAKVFAQILSPQLD